MGPIVTVGNAARAGAGGGGGAGAVGVAAGVGVGVGVGAGAAAGGVDLAAAIVGGGVTLGLAAGALAGLAVTAAGTGGVTGFNGTGCAGTPLGATGVNCSGSGGSVGAGVGTGAATAGFTAGLAAEDGEAAPSGGNCPVDAASGVTGEDGAFGPAVAILAAAGSVPPAVPSPGILLDVVVVVVVVLLVVGGAGATGAGGAVTAAASTDGTGTLSTIGPPSVSVRSCPTRSRISFSIAARRTSVGVTVSKSLRSVCTDCSRRSKRASSLAAGTENNGVNFIPSGGARARKASMGVGPVGTAAAAAAPGGAALPLLVVLSAKVQPDRASEETQSITHAAARQRMKAAAAGLAVGGGRTFALEVGNSIPTRAHGPATTWLRRMLRVKKESPLKCHFSYPTLIVRKSNAWVKQKIKITLKMIHIRERLRR